jgi:hypothetical protein
MQSSQDLNLDSVQVVWVVSIHHLDACMRCSEGQAVWCALALAS